MTLLSGALLYVGWEIRESAEGKWKVGSQKKEDQNGQCGGPFGERKGDPPGHRFSGGLTSPHNKKTPNAGDDRLAGPDGRKGQSRRKEVGVRGLC